MTRLLHCAALGLAVLVSGQARAQAPDAKTLNAQGYDLYKLKQWAPAIAKFREATVADPKYALGWYNLAATLSLMRKQNKTCEFDAYRHTITDFLTRAVELDAGRKARMQKDGDLDPIRDTIAYQLLLGVDPTNKEGLTKLLRNVSWWGPATGAFGSMYGMKFEANGVASYWELQMDAEGTPVKKTFKAKWKLEPAKIGAPQVVIELPARGDKKAQQLRGGIDARVPPGRVSGPSKVKPTKLTFDGDFVLTDEPSECEA